VLRLQSTFSLLALASLMGCAGPSRHAGWGADGLSGTAFYLGAYSLPSRLDGKSQLYVLVDVAYADLQFVLNNEGYQARFEISIALMNQAGTEVVRDVQRQIFVDNFAATASRERFERVGVSFDPPPGDYQLVVSVTDKNSSGRRVRRGGVRAKEFRSQPVAVSDIMFFDHLPETEIVPAQTLPGYRGNYPEEFYAVARITASNPQSSLEINYKLHAPTGEVILKDQFTHAIARDGEWLKIKLRRDDLRVGENQLEVQVQSGNAKDQAHKRFLLRWSGMPETTSSLDDAIEQLGYVASRGEASRMRKAAEAEKKKWFEEFWTQRDPTPSTPENELQEEYYARVAEANRRFYVEGRDRGWRTDRGRIFILYGPPDNVSRETSYRDFTVTYEIWYYEAIGRRFIFRDDGSGRYTLIAMR
jgi:GWxTD domain-containing protein